MSREILCGPAGSGKTRSVLDEYVATIREHGDDSALLILPSRLACERVRRRLVAEGRVGGLLDPRILTFPDLARLILDANHASVSRISDLQQRLLVQQVTDDLCAEGQVRALAPMCRFPGFIRSICDLINELKRIAIDSETFAGRVRGAGVDDERGREVAAIYRRYQRHLQASDPPLYDDPGAFWWARDLLNDGRRRPFEQLRSILVAGFDDFTTTQLQVLAELSEIDSARRLLIALPYDEHDERTELFRRPARTLKRIREILGEIDCAPTDGEAPDRPLAAMGARLFAEGEVQPLSDGADRIRIIETSGRRMEVRQVLGRIKDLLRDGADPSTIGIIARDLSGYASALQEVAREMGVPVRVRASEPASARPSVQAVLDVVRVPAEQFLATDVMRLIKSTWFDRAALGEDAPDPDEIERVCAEAAIIGGRAEPGEPPIEHWRDRLDRHARRLQLQRERTEDPE
jgi:ATP-dependent helicase/DNAse subunit B